LFEIYQNKKVFITGHTGFKGSWLSLWLLKIGAEIIGYALDPQNEKDNYVLAELEHKIKDFRNDIRDYTKLANVINTEQPEIIFHLAAQPLVLDSYKDPHYTIETNTQGTANIIEAFRNSETVKALIVITTDKVYQNNEREWGYQETDRLGGKDPYSASKAAAELLISSYQKSFFNNNNKLLVSVRAGNVIGGGDWSENRIVPDCIKALERSERIIIRNPHATRPWQHVLEPLGGYLLLGEKLLQNRSEFVGAWNFGPYLSNVINVKELVKKVIIAYGMGEYIIQNNMNSQAEANFLSLDITKAINKLSWKPLLNIDETIDFTIEWYKNYNSTNVFNFCHNQITKYEELWKLRNKK